ncbi:filament-like plant protein 4 [Aristolochia californica]|uniref:filament-like plant protein 4 n=1 Tax=Aristolochia californica TaxID=171875 RepID=UPI0035DC8055
MDRRSWPWRKKSSSDKEKVVAAPELANVSSANSSINHVEENISKKVKYVQITEETYANLKDQVKDLNEKLSLTNEKLASALGENTTKENLVKQHAKVAEEAVSGWEKAEAEAIALKSQLESVTLLKLTAEDRAAHLDGALKECMRQIRSVKEESEQKLHDVVFTKTKQWEKIKGEFESRIIDLEQELLRASADNNALSRSLLERSNLLIKMSEEKSQADAQIEVLKSNVQSCEKDINSLKYELHIVSKEVEIRNEEKNMSLRSEDVANRQHLEGVKKIAKLEAECQRLRGLVRKKLPGPAALAQMKLEVESLGRDYGETRLRRSPVKCLSPHMATPTEFSLESVQKSHKETEFLTARLLTTEEETKMLKEALSKRNSELQASRNMCAKTTSKLRSLEAQIQFLSQQVSPSKLNLEIPLSFSQSASNPPSITSMSEDGIDEEASCADSWATASISDLSHIKKEKKFERGGKTETSKHLELMDDFLEMERLACLSTKSNGTVSVSDNLIDKGIQKTSPESNVAKSSNLNPEESSVESKKKEVSLESLQSRITLILESQGKHSDLCNILEDIRKVAEDMPGSLPHQFIQFISGESKVPAEDMLDTENGISLKCENKPCIETTQLINQEIKRAIYEIQSFIVSLGKEAKEIQSGDHDDLGLSQMTDEFLQSVDKVLSGELGVVNLIYKLSCVLAKATELNFNIVGLKGSEGENSVSDCVDKVTLLENKLIEPDQTKERLPSDCPHVSDSIADPEIIQDIRLEPSFELKGRLCKCSQNEIEQLKLERENLALDLVRCNESLEQRTVQLDQTEKLLVELKSQLASSQKSNSLAETQLKCMVESYKSLEARTQDLEIEMNLLREMAKALEIELQEEKQNHHDALARYKDLEVKCNDLEEQIQRTEKCSMCSPSLADDSEKNKQEREIAAAAEKLAECQETILLLGKHLNALRSPTDHGGSSHDEGYKISTDMQDNEASSSGMNSRGPGSQDFDQADRIGGEASLNSCNGTMSSSDTEPSPFTRSPINFKRPKHKATRSSSSASSLVMTPEKNGRGFSRFFSRGKAT